jgi:tetratricopeptide (TPR) repeat protein
MRRVWCAQWGLHLKGNRMTQMHCLSIFAIALLVCMLIGCEPSAPAPVAPDNGTTENGNSDEDDISADQPTAQYPHEVYKDLAQVYLRYRILDEAIRNYELAAKVQYERTGEQDAEIHVGLGEAYAILIQQGAPENREQYRSQAAESFRNALTIYTELHDEQGPEYIAEGKNVEYNQLVARIARIHGLLGEDDKRREWLARLRADENNWQQQVELAQIHEQLERHERAEERYKRALTLTEEDAPNRAEVQVRYAAFLNKVERQDEAITIARAVVNNEEATSEAKRLARRLLFDIYDARGELDKLDFN